MTLIRRLADHALETQPGRAATALERLGTREAIAALQRSRLESAVSIVARLSPQSSSAVLEGLEPTRAANLLEGLSIDVAARLARRISRTHWAEISESLHARRARAIAAVLQFPERTAGALMDPDVLALPQELTSREALARVRVAARQAHYNLYVIDQTQRLVGALNLRELLSTDESTLLSELMTRNPHRLLATADRASVLNHPGWRKVHALPVVDRHDAYLGAVRYRALRALEDELLATSGLDADTGEAFGQVIAAGARGLLAAFTEPATAATGGGRDQRSEG